MSSLDKGKKFVISLGGSIAFPEKINLDFLKNFYLFIKKEIKKGNRFIIVAGGGEITRKYQSAAAKITKVTNEDKDWIGIHATRLNAHLLRTVFKREANPFVFDKRFKIGDFGKYSIIIASGWRPGWSTDYVAVQLAADFKIKLVINLSKADYVYTADFQKYPEAKPIEKISWKEYLKLIPKKWTPGLHVPVDPIAAQLAKKKNLKVIVVSGLDLNNLRNILRGKSFKGTVLSGSKVVIGGTFETLHQGHWAFLKRAFELGEVFIGLTSDEMAEGLKRRKVKDFKERKKELEDFIKKEFSAKPEIVKIEDKFGPALKGDFDYIVVSPETYKTAVLLNEKRKEIGKEPIEIVKLNFILAEDGKPISDSRILKKEIDRGGKLLSGK